MSIKVQFDKDIPVPDDTRHRWPLEEMAVGDSFAFPAKKHRSVEQQVQRLHKQQKGHWTVRKWQEGQYRCWRVQ